jgi:diaminohydroxyphosphoribosylaminopyrimidine deaminase/5-amino-6-(5-phosphoribosylamino)uracil reductase
LLVEGGSAVLGSFLDAKAIDEVHMFVAPMLIGGSNAPTPVGGEGMARVGDAVTFQDWQVTQVEGDVYWRGWAIDAAGRAAC